MSKTLFLASLLLLLLSSSVSFVLSEDTEITSSALPPHPIASHSPAHAPFNHHHHHHNHHHHNHNHHHNHPPTISPVHSPAPSHHGHGPTTSHAPAHSPVVAQPPKNPHHPPAAHAPVAQPPHVVVPRSFVAVQGVVYCKSCLYAAGHDTLNNATAVLGATVKLVCSNTKYPLVVQWKTDKNGYFYITAPKTITSYGAHKCKVILVSSPNSACSKPSSLHFGAVGASLRPEKKFTDQHGNPFILYTVGPFAFDPKCPK
ncbi:hypothetical protein ACFE04_020229 [Oxalis oulophora]